MWFCMLCTVLMQNFHKSVRLLTNLVWDTWLVGHEQYIVHSCDTTIDKLNEASMGSFIIVLLVCTQLVG